MTYEDFKKEYSKQLSINAKYFKPKEIQILQDFGETFQKEDFNN